MSVFGRFSKGSRPENRSGLETFCVKPGWSPEAHSLCLTNAELIFFFNIKHCLE